jgi:hypothetical protein
MEVVMYFPTDRSDVTETWVAEMLEASKTFPVAPIENVELEHLGDGLGQLSSLILADIELADGESKQVVIKLHAPIPAMHDIAMKYGHYESEVNFYNHLADQISVRTPRIYLSAMDKEAQRVALIMESFSDWHSPDQIKGATTDEITIATRELAKISATYWNKPIQTQHPWIRDMNSSVYDSLQPDYIACTDIALDRMHDALPASTERAARRIGPAINELKHRNGQGNQTLAHWDYRVENLFYRNDEFAVIDWQLMMVTNPATDLAYLLATNIDVELRRSMEDELIRAFLDGLENAGVTDYQRDDFEKDFRLALLTISGIAIIAGANFDESNKRSAQLVKKITSRMFQAIEDWQALDVL